jgi:hypothetical protein
VRVAIDRDVRCVPGMFDPPKLPNVRVAIPDQLAQQLPAVVDGYARPFGHFLRCAGAAISKRQGQLVNRDHSLTLRKVAAGKPGGWCLRPQVAAHKEGAAREVRGEDVRRSVMSAALPPGGSRGR